MSEIKLILAKGTEATELRDISVVSFRSDFEKYGSYPPGIESVY